MIVAVFPDGNVVLVYDCGDSISLGAIVTVFKKDGESTEDAIKRVFPEVKLVVGRGRAGNGGQGGTGV